MKKFEILCNVRVVPANIACLIKLNKLRKLSTTNLNSFSHYFHDTAHKLRDGYAFICKRFKSPDKILTSDELSQNLINTTQDIVDNLSEILNNATGERISVCIKYFPLTPDGSVTLPERSAPSENSEFSVLCRCKNTDPKRNNKEYNNGRLKDNTDLHWITFRQYTEFAKTNLIEFDRHLKKSTGAHYRNSNMDWQDFYKAKITVPIQLDCNHTFLDQNKKKSYDLIGFISADAASTSAFREENIVNYINICKAFADMLYRYLERYGYLREELYKREGLSC